METKQQEPRFSKSDFDNWKKHPFTEFFFESMEKDIEEGKKGLLNLCLNNADSLFIKQKSESLNTLIRILRMDIDDLLFINNESNDYE